VGVAAISVVANAVPVNHLASILISSDSLLRLCAILALTSFSSAVDTFPNLRPARHPIEALDMIGHHSAWAIAIRCPRKA
jgi:hypothetical protein